VELVDQPGSEQRAVDPTAGRGQDTGDAELLLHPSERDRQVDPFVPDDEVGDAFPA
jgi:hypothetical protein